MHPVIRVLSVIVSIAFLASPVWETVLFVMLSSLLILIFKARYLLKVCLGMIRRLKWLYLSIFFVYGWFTPGEAIISVAMINEVYLPTLAGLQSGLLRVLVLMAIVIMVTGLLRSIERDRLVSTIVWLIMPLRFLGLDIQRFALLLVLTLDKVLTSETSMRKDLQANQQASGLFDTAATMLCRQIDKIENPTDDKPPIEITLRSIGPPPLWQWSVPFLLATVLYMLS